MTVGSKTATYAYDADGIRTQKTVDGVTHTYYTLNGKLMRESFPYNGSTFIMDFIYDESGKPFALSYSSNGGESFYVYYYGVNAQGDVEKIFGFTTNEETGKEEEYIYGYYTYDAWGNVTAHTRSGGTPSTTSIVYRNPIRYRGYVYDNETGWYYLQSRYYDPANHRFINADSYASTDSTDPISCNMFAYCGNNPVNRIDPTGEAWWEWALAAVVVAVAAVAVVVTAGGAAAGMAAVAAVASGTAASSTAATVAAGVFIGSSVGLATSAYEAASTSRSLDEFADQGTNGLFSTIAGGAIGGTYAYNLTKPVCAACFIAGTPVLTADGDKPIERVQAGDYVWAWDEETGDVALKPVVEVYVNETNELTHIFVDGREIIATPEHPFYTPVYGWTSAAHLRAGDILVLVNGEYVVVEKIQHELLESPVKVYNFQVEDYHTYYVGVGVLVHNRCSNSMRTPDQQALADLAKEVKNNAKHGQFISYNEAQILDDWAMEYGVPQHHQALIGSGSH